MREGEGEKREGGREGGRREGEREKRIGSREGVPWPIGAMPLHVQCAYYIRSTRPSPSPSPSQVLVRCTI